MYIYFLLFQDTGRKDDCDCKIEDDVMKFFFNHSVCDVSDISPPQWFRAQLMIGLKWICVPVHFAQFREKG